ncbi:T9SS type A sorting domain-containing protein [Aequorivita sp. H23M31]|uniref:T9SS type A sorting domain-containing protein n=1 Tax=Aequorivita ciconiae TaxID=2494375 RepID=A0A410FZQ3_9FLAO|nr:T9SS type A sorting domain-containing protein [Aequorivita sp. H23M31]QAA80480.1 T9SS type A sorting domain-containing protein [Aequorivita sp. H23M31]
MTDGACETIQVFDANALGVMDYINMANDLKIARNPLHNNILELEYPKNISYLDVTVYDMTGKKIAEYKNTAQDTALVVNAGSGIYIAQVVDPITGTGKNLRFVIQ